MPTNDRWWQHHGEDALANLGVKAKVAVSLQSGDQARQDGLEAFATDSVGGFPEDDQRLSHRLIVGAPSHDRSSGSERCVGGKQSDGVLAVAASDGDELIKDLALVMLGGLLITLTQQLKQFALALLADLFRHRMPPVFGNLPVRQ